jgi:O-antigen ligase
VLAAYAAGLHRAAWLPFSAQARVVIWAHTAQQISAAPLFGAGIRAARQQEVLDALRVETAPGTIHQLTTEAHAHNVYLQVWYELGAVGALIGMIAGVLVLQTIGRLDDATRPWLLATFVACAVNAAFSFGLWQPWFMAAFAMVAVFGTLAATYAPRERAP